MNKFYLIISLTFLFCSSAFSQDLIERGTIEERTNRVVTNESRPAPYYGQPGMSSRGGGGITSTDCYSFVPVPDDAIELDPFAFSNSSIDGLDGWWGLFDLDFDFCHFGDPYDQFYISAKGNVTFGNGMTVFIPTDFPSDEFNMISGYWTDIDYRCEGCGEVYYWTTPTAAYITYVGVGYFNNNNDKNNTFQIVITDETDEIVGLGNNVGFFYQDMQFGVGDTSLGSANGFGGTAPATVGATKNDGNTSVKIGRFSSNTDDYDGPEGNDDGVNWLDNKGFVFSICSTEDNLPPASFNSDACDTIFICQNDTYELDVYFSGPEQDQSVTISVNDSDADGWVLNTNENGNLSGTFTGGADNVGEHTITVTATDDHNIPASTVLVYNIVVQDIVLPELVVTGEAFDDVVASYCQGADGAILNASDGFDNYFWTNGTSEQEATLSAGQYLVTGVFSGCEAEYGPISVFQIPVYNPPVSVFDNLLCNGETTTVSVQSPQDYDNFAWEVSTTSGGTILTDTTLSSIEVEAGVYVLTVIDDNNCPGTSFAVVNEEIVEIPDNNFPQLCDNDDQVFWSGAWANPNTCGQNLMMFDSEGDTWEGAYVEVFVDGVGPFTYSITSGFGQVLDGVNAIHGQLIDYYFFPGLDDDDINLTIWDTDNNVVFNTEDGDVLSSGEFPFFSQVAECGFNALEGDWSVDGPEGWEMDFSNQYNPVAGANSFTAPEDFIGSYTLTFNSEICETEETFDLEFNDTPTVTALDYLGNCSDSPVLISPEYGSSDVIDAGGIQYSWDPGLAELIDGQPTNEVTQSVNYTITVENECGENEDSGVVEIIPTPNPSLSDVTICNNDNTNLDPITTNHPSFQYTWSGDGIADINADEITVNNSGTYSVSVENDCGTETASAVISQNFSPSVTAIDSLPICPGEVENLAPFWSDDVSNVSWSYTWLDTLGNTQFDVLETTTPTLTFGADQIDPFAVGNNVLINYSTSNICGLASGSTVAFIDACYLAAANVFSPDNDSADGLTNIPGTTRGLNETWHVVGIDGISNVDVKIFNRWGVLVYENANYKNTSGWDGSNDSGNDLEEGVYFYTVTVPNREDELRGTVTLLRKK